MNPVADSGGLLVCLGWLALTPALTEIRLLAPACCSASSCCRMTRTGTRGLAASWLFSSRRQAHFLLAAPTLEFLMPNVRVKTAPTV